VTRRIGAWRGVLVITHHRIGEPTDSRLDWDLWSARPDDFAAQVRFLSRNFELVDPGALGPEMARARGRRVLLTFDDGYRDNYDVAYRVLREHGVRAAFFITTGFLDGDATAWWDEIAWMVRASERRTVPADGFLDGTVEFDDPNRQGAVAALRRTCASLPGRDISGFLDWLSRATAVPRRDPADARADWMSWDQLREIEAGGMTVGAHTVTHPVLSSISLEDQRREVRQSIERIEEELGSRPDLFSYPVGWRGSFTDQTKALVRDSGARLAFSNYGGFVSGSNWDPHDIPRANLGVDTDAAVFRAMTTIPQLFARW